jgi:hypothetical protein
LSAQQRAGRSGQGAQEPRAAKAIAAIDLTGYWVPVITEDWRWRMLTPPKGDYASVPVNNEGRRLADTWDLAKDDATGNSCKPFGIGNIMRMPGRLHTTWQDDDTLKLEFDAGTQTRLLHFTGTPPAVRSDVAGYSVASWEWRDSRLSSTNGIPVASGSGGDGVDGGGGGGGRGGAGGARARGGAARGGSLKVVTTNMREGYLQNGVPYGAGSVVTESLDRVGPGPNGDVIPARAHCGRGSKYLREPFIHQHALQARSRTDDQVNRPRKIDPRRCRRGR